MKLKPLTSLIDEQVEPLPLLPELEQWYGGGLSLPEAHDGRPGIYSNFVMSLDGRITFDEPGHYSGGDISFRNPHDRMLMGVLRSAADAVLVGAETLRVEPKHVWTARGLFRNDPEAADLVARQRAAFGLPDSLLHFFVTGSGRLGERPYVLDAPDAEVWFITTRKGKAALDEQFPEQHVNTWVPSEGDRVDLASVLPELYSRFGVRRLLSEGGPTLIGSLIEANGLDRAFLAISPQIIGNAPGKNEDDRPTWINGYFGHPGETPTARLLSLKLDPNHAMQFTQYAVSQVREAGGGS